VESRQTGSKTSYLLPGSVEASVLRVKEYYWLLFHSFSMGGTPQEKKRIFAVIGRQVIMRKDLLTFELLIRSFPLLCDYAPKPFQISLYTV
jgi:hypothetical protein